MFRTEFQQMSNAQWVSFHRFRNNVRTSSYWMITTCTWPDLGVIKNLLLTTGSLWSQECWQWETQEAGGFPFQTLVDSPNISFRVKRKMNTTDLFYECEHFHKFHGGVMIAVPFVGHFINTGKASFITTYACFLINNWKQHYDI